MIASICPCDVGAWATAAARVAAKNLLTQDRKAVFQPTIKMWVYEEVVNDRNLSELINERHENVKYLPGISLPENLVACPDLDVSTPSSFQSNIYVCFGWSSMLPSH